jgi:hypothetical protein
MKWTKPHCSGTASATGTIIDNNNAQLWQRSPASATEGSAVVFDFSLSNPSGRYNVYFVSTMELLEVITLLLMLQ